MIVGMDDDVGGPLAIDNHDILVLGDCLPNPARDTHVLSFDRRHVGMIAKPYLTVRISTAPLSASENWRRRHQRVVCTGDYQACNNEYTVASGSPIDTSPGQHTFTISAELARSGFQPSGAVESSVTYTVQSPSGVGGSPSGGGSSGGAHRA